MATSYILRKTEYFIAAVGFTVYLLSWLMTPVGLLLGIAYGFPLLGLIAGCLSTLGMANSGMHFFDRPLHTVARSGRWPLAKARPGVPSV